MFWELVWIFSEITSYIVKSALSTSKDFQESRQHPHGKVCQGKEPATLFFNGG